MKTKIHPKIKIGLVSLLFSYYGLSAQPLYGASTLENEIAERLAEADSLHSVGRTDTAAIIGDETIRIAEKNGNRTLIVGANAAQGVYLRSLGKIEEALQKYNRALQIVTDEKFRKNPDQEAIEQAATLYINLATLNLDMQNKEEAVRNVEMADTWLKRSKDADLKSICYGAGGSVLIAAGEYAKAFDFEKEAYRYAEISKDTDGAFRAAAYSMLLADRTGDISSAQEWREKCNTLLPEIKALMTQLVYYQAECSIALKHQRPQEALKWFQKILSLDGIENLPFIQYDCLNNMHIAYSETGDYKNAYSTLLKSNELRDSIWEKQKEESLRELTVKYETKEKELALAQSETQKSHILMWLFAALAILASLIGWFVYYSSRQKRNRIQKEKEFAELRNETERRLTEEYLEGLEAERIRMSRELHDGVCNDLLAIRMSIQRNGVNRETEELIERCRESVRRVSHELMPPEFSYATLLEVLNYYLAQQAKSLGDDIEIIYDNDGVAEPLDDLTDESALEIYRIVQEAVGNAIKYSGGTRITITLRTEGNELTITVEDNGKFKNNDKKGIGLESIRKRAATLKGTVSIENSDGSESQFGTRITLKVDLSRLKKK